MFRAKTCLSDTKPDLSNCVNQAQGILRIPGQAECFLLSSSYARVAGDKARTPSAIKKQCDGSAVEMRARLMLVTENIALDHNNMVWIPNEVAAMRYQKNKEHHWPQHFYLMYPWIDGIPLDALSP